MPFIRLNKNSSYFAEGYAVFFPEKPSKKSGHFASERLCRGGALRSPGFSDRH